MDIKGFGISGQQSSVENIVSKLKFISRLKEGDKIDIRNMSVVKDDYVSRLNRTMSGCKREDSLKFMKNTIENAIELVQYYYSQCRENQFNKDVGDLIIENISKAKIGIENQIKTYSSDIKFITELETVIEIINIKTGKN